MFSSDFTDDEFDVLPLLSGPRFLILTGNWLPIRAHILAISQDVCVVRSTTFPHRSGALLTWKGPTQSVKLEIRTLLWTLVFPGVEKAFYVGWGPIGAKRSYRSLLTDRGLAD